MDAPLVSKESHTKPFKFYGKRTWAGEGAGDNTAARSHGEGRGARWDGDGGTGWRWQGGDCVIHGWGGRVVACWKHTVEHVIWPHVSNSRSEKWHEARPHAIWETVREKWHVWPKLAPLFFKKKIEILTPKIFVSKQLQIKFVTKVCWQLGGKLLKLNN